MSIRGISVGNQPFPAKVLSIAVLCAEGETLGTPTVPKSMGPLEIGIGGDGFPSTLPKDWQVGQMPRIAEIAFL